MCKKWHLLAPWLFFFVIVNNVTWEGKKGIAFESWKGYKSLTGGKQKRSMGIMRETQEGN